MGIAMELMFRTESVALLKQRLCAGSSARLFESGEPHDAAGARDRRPGRRAANAAGRCSWGDRAGLGWPACAGMKQDANGHSHLLERWSGATSSQEAWPLNLCVRIGSTFAVMARVRLACHPRGRQQIRPTEHDTTPRAAGLGEKKRRRSARIRWIRFARSGSFCRICGIPSVDDWWRGLI